MRSMFVMALLLILVVGAILFFRGYSNSVNLYHICGKEVSWYEAAFLNEIKDKSGCQQYQSTTSP
jgi:hypothetical protein